MSSTELTETVTPFIDPAMSKRSLAGSIWTTPDQYKHTIDPDDDSSAVPDRKSTMYKVVGDMPNGIDGTNPKLSQYFEVAWSLKIVQKEEKSEWEPHRLHIFSKKDWKAVRKGKPMQRTKPQI